MDLNVTKILESLYYYFVCQSVIYIQGTSPELELTDIEILSFLQHIWTIWASLAWYEPSKVKIIIMLIWAR